MLAGVQNNTLPARETFLVLVRPCTDKDLPTPVNLDELYAHVHLPDGNNASMSNMTGPLALCNGLLGSNSKRVHMCGCHISQWELHPKLEFDQFLLS